jgi:hypothetical protein
MLLWMLGYVLTFLALVAITIIGPLVFLAALWLAMLPIQLGEWLLERHRRRQNLPL